jgi:glycerate dehydrogenase
MKATVLDGATVNPGDNPWSPVEKWCSLSVFDRTPESAIVERGEGSEILLTNKTPISAKTMEKLPSLRFISVLATGYNVVDIEEARRRNIPVSNVPAYSTDSVAQHVMAMILGRMHRPEAHFEAVRNRAWVNSPDFCFWLSPFNELAGQTMGLIGFGQIGRRVAELALAFGMNVLAYTPVPARKTRPPSERFDFCTIQQVFRESDYVSLHCPLDASNAGFVNAQLLSLMKKTAVFINTARGGLVNETDLERALEDGTIAGACLDVVTQEPMRDNNPLLTARNCLITPHMAWGAVEARRRLMRVTADNVEAYVSGQPIHVVNGVLRPDRVPGAIA